MAETCFIAETRHLTQGSEMAVKRAKRAAGHLCEVTGQNASRQKKMDLSGQHIVDRRTPPGPGRLDRQHPGDHSRSASGVSHLDGPGELHPNHFLNFAEAVCADLFDPVNPRQKKQLQTLTRRMKRLQQEWEGRQVRYHRN